MSITTYRQPAGLTAFRDPDRPCLCSSCGARFDGPEQLHEAVAPVCLECGSEDVDELPAERSRVDTATVPVLRMTVRQAS